MLALTAIALALFSLFTAAMRKKFILEKLDNIDRHLEHLRMKNELIHEGRIAEPDPDKFSLECWKIWGYHMESQYLNVCDERRRLEAENEKLRERKWWHSVSRCA